MFNLIIFSANEKNIAKEGNKKGQDSFVNWMPFIYPFNINMTLVNRLIYVSNYLIALVMINSVVIVNII